MAGLTGGRGGSAISVGGSLEPVDPVYTNANHQSPLGTKYPVPRDPAMSYLDAPVVKRGERTNGMRYLWADIRQRMAIQTHGTGPDIGIGVWSSEFQPYQGSLRDYGFNDRLFEAGYPGFNLGLTFKVPRNPSVATTAPGTAMRMKPPPRDISIKILRRATARPNMRG